MAPSLPSRLSTIPTHMSSAVIWGRRFLPVADQRLNLRSVDDDQQSLANQGVELMDEDSILMCTDGLTDHVKDKEIVGILQKHPGKSQDSVNELIDLACQRGGKDNITIILITIPKPNLFKSLFKLA